MTRESIPIASIYVPVKRRATLNTDTVEKLAQLALQFSIAHPDMATCVVGSANPANVQKWAKWAAKPMDEQ